MKNPNVVKTLVILGLIIWASLLTSVAIAFGLFAWSEDLQKNCGPSAWYGQLRTFVTDI